MIQSRAVIQPRTAGCGGHPRDAFDLLGHDAVGRPFSVEGT
jgi:hypothetical protein